MRSLAIGVALLGQLQIAGGKGVVLATRCYAIGILLWLLASLRPGATGVPFLPKPLWAREPRGERVRRVVWLEIAIGLCLSGAVVLRSSGYDSRVGALTWLASVVILLLAFREKPARARAAGVRERISSGEFALLLLVLGVALFLRFYRLGDWLGGMHGDEGEAGLDAMRVLRGEHVPPFGTGWFGQGNLYYWCVALGMKFAGTGLFGLRVFSALAGVLLLAPTYLLARRWFGARVAILSAAFLAISDVAINFSRLEFSNVTTPLSLAAGFLFLFRGLRNGRLLDFLLAGFAHAAGLYFYQGGRLTPLLGLAFLGYLLVLLPLLTAAGAAIRRAPGRAPRRVLRQQLRRARRLGVPALVYLVALLTFGAPFVAFSFDNREEATSRVKEKLVFNNESRMTATHAVGHAPLFLGLRRPHAADTLPVPVVFEKTPLSLQIGRDGFWPRVLWRQLLVTLSILTYREDASSIYTFSHAPIAKPFEAVLIILSLAWALAGVRDPRRGALTIWFWGTIVVGGVLTIDAPYMARLVGILPVLAIAAAFSLDALSRALEGALPRRGRGAGKVLLVAVLLALAGQNFRDYFDRYTRTSPPFAPTVGQAWFVRETNRRASAEGRPFPHYYDLGAHEIYWSHSVNRFLNPDATGMDLANPSQSLPLADPPDADAIFLVWDNNRHYLPILEALYPGGKQERFLYGLPGRGESLFFSYRVPAGELERRRTTLASYSPARGPAVSRVESRIGTGDPLPRELVYPVRARWKGAIFAPAFARYRLEVQAPAMASLDIDRVPALASDTRAGELVLARGLHEVELAAELTDPDARVQLKWGAAGLGVRAVARQFVWAGPGRSLLGFVRALPQGESPAAFFRSPLFEGLPLLSARIDSFLGFKDAEHALGADGKPLVAVWKGTIRATQGRAAFELRANPGALLAVDGRRVLEVPEGGPRESSAASEIDLAPGVHEIEVWYSWVRDVGTLELFWTPPGGQRALLGADELAMKGGAWRPGGISEPRVVLPDLGAAAAIRLRSADLAGLVQEPRALAVASNGELFVADTGGHRVVRLDSNGKFLGAFGRAGRGGGEFERLEDIALDRSGRIYTLDSSFARVQVFLRDGTLLRTMGQNSGLCTPAGFGLGPDGSVYVADTCGGRIVKFEEGGRRVKEIRPAPPAKLDQPVDVAIGEDGLLYIADLTPRLIALDPATGAIRRAWPIAVGTLVGGSNLSLNGTRLYVSDPNRNVVLAIDVSGGDLEPMRGHPSAPFAAPLGVACSPENTLYVIDRNGKRLQAFADPLAGERR